ncbi:MAG: hypothetical protein WC824_11965 [Bacteroidota bacterium]|jgi:hypothetical protein
MMDWAQEAEDVWNARDRRHPVGRIFADGTVPTVSLKVMKDGFEALRKVGVQVDFVFMNPDTWIQFRGRITEVTDARMVLGSLDLVTQVPHPDILRFTFQGTLWGASVLLEKRCPRNRIWFVGERNSGKYRKCSVITVV